MYQLTGRERSGLLPEAIQEVQIQVSDGVGLDIGQEFLPIALQRFNLASLADEANHETVAKQKLVAKTVFRERNIALKHLGIKVVQCVFTLPCDANGVPRGRDAGSANVKAAMRGNEAVLVTQRS